MNITNQLAKRAERRPKKSVPIPAKGKDRRPVNNITSQQLSKIFAAVDADGNEVVDAAEFRSLFRRLNLGTTAKAVDAKWLTVSKDSGEPVTFEALAHTWGVELSADEVGTDADASQESIYEVIALRGLLLSMEAEAKDENVAMLAAAAAVALLEDAARRPRRSSGQREPRMLLRRDSLVVQVRATSNAISDESAHMSFWQAADVGECGEMLEYIAAGGNINVCDERKETVLHNICRMPPRAPTGARSSAPSRGRASTRTSRTGAGGRRSSCAPSTATWTSPSGSSPTALTWPGCRTSTRRCCTRRCSRASRAGSGIDLYGHKLIAH